MHKWYAFCLFLDMKTNQIKNANLSAYDSDQELSFEELIKRLQKGESFVKEQLLEALVKDIYEYPSLYGLKTEDEAGEIFAAYWNRIRSLPDRYEKMGSSFRAYASTAIKYMALNMRRKSTTMSCKENAYVSFYTHEIASTNMAPLNQDTQNEEYSLLKDFPKKHSHGRSALAFRRKFLFICIKNAFLLDDDDAISMARTVGIDENYLIHLLEKARLIYGRDKVWRHLCERRRNSAWLRLYSNEKQLSKEPDSQMQSILLKRIKNDRALYYKAIMRLFKSSMAIPNKAVAEFFSLPKGTIDSCLSRLTKIVEGVTENENKQ